MIVNSVDQWIREAGHNICIIMAEFGNLNDNQFRYTTHIRRCSIIETMMNLTNVNERFISHLESTSTLSRTGWYTKALGRNLLTRYIIKNSVGFKCRKRQHLQPDYREVFQKLSIQQEKLIYLRGSYSDPQLNAKAIAFTSFGIIKIRLDVYFEYILECQAQHIVQARRQLMLQ